jgi:hypothetical protein
MTIPLLRVSMKGIFECGQAYVALSRATDLQGTDYGVFRHQLRDIFAGLQLTDYSPHVVKAHPQVVIMSLKR